MSDPVMLDKATAKQEFAALVRLYGWKWGPDHPAEAFARLAEINTVLTEDDRREALGLHPRSKRP